MAADSQSTEGTGSVRSTTNKLFQLTDMAVAGCSGMGQICYEIARNCAGLPNDACHEMGESIKKRFTPVVSRHYAGYIAFVPGQAPTSPATSLLAAGIDPAGKPWIIEVDSSTQYTHYEPKGFHAIGSGAEGAQHAIAILSHFQVQNNEVKYGLMVMTRVIFSVVRTAAEGLGEPVDIWVVDSNGPRKLTQDEIQRQLVSVGDWANAEKDTLDQLLYGNKAAGKGIPTDDPPILAEPSVVESTSQNP